LQTPAIFTAGRLAIATQMRGADMLLKYLASPQALPALQESGLESVR
jgi:molybdate transport system substrate-binding protein